jgi:DNA-directed RNA polymerase specialized sigma24 family protein
MNTFALTEDVPRRVSAHSEEDRDEYLQSLRALLRSVPRRVRIVIALRLRGWTYQRIGKKYGRSKQWAKELLGQYRDRMRLALER